MQSKHHVIWWGTVLQSVSKARLKTLLYCTSLHFSLLLGKNEQIVFYTRFMSWPNQDGQKGYFDLYYFNWTDL